MRGKVAFNLRHAVKKGITPAYAGKRLLSRWIPPFRWDHPRLCGEKEINSHYTFSFSGSPPPMRGKADFISTLYLLTRITPAYAGKRPLFVY